MSSQLSLIQKELRSAGTCERAEVSKWFFKTGKGQYGEGDVFIGITVPIQRAIAKRYHDMPLSDVATLLHSKEHEFRLTALLILVAQFEKAGQRERKEIYETYLANTAYINNWDLVDLSAPSIVGEYLADRSHAKLISLARSQSLWERRIAIVATFAFIRRGESDTTFALARMMVHDSHDLIQKAVGWMLREVGKRVSETELKAFLDVHAHGMPRTMLRYAIERLSPGDRAGYLSYGVGRRRVAKE
jgi:3-methyladenine DNA glycosylase AlkD